MTAASIPPENGSSVHAQGPHDARSLSPRQGHPKGLYLLFASEMWERMSYYGMRALLVLYMTRATTDGGFGWSESNALKLYGIYCGLVYLTPLFGGALADRRLGQRRSVLIGGALMMVGHFLMAAPGKEAFFAALGFLIVGNGLFKPNISTMVGALYSDDDPRRDGAFTIFYMGINVGAVLASFVCGTLGERFGFHWGFGSAGVGMALGLAVFAIGAPRVLGTIGLPPLRPPTPSEEASLPQPAGPSALTSEERDRIGVIAVLAFFSIFFWVAFEQAGGLMNLYTDQKVDRHIFGWEMPTTWFQALNPVFIITLAPWGSRLWTYLAQRGKDPSPPLKMAIGIAFLSFGFVLMMGASLQSASVGKAHLLWVVGAYFFHTVGELCLSPIGLSVVTKLAPAHLGSLMMGVWFFANFLSDTLAGFVGAYSEHLGEFPLFGAIVVTTAVAALALATLSRSLVQRMHGRV